MKAHLRDVERPGRYLCGRRIKPTDNWTLCAPSCESCDARLEAMTEDEEAPGGEAARTR